MGLFETPQQMQDGTDETEGRMLSETRALSLSLQTVDAPCAGTQVVK